MKRQNQVLFLASLLSIGGPDLGLGRGEHLETRLQCVDGCKEDPGDSTRHPLHLLPGAHSIRLRWSAPGAELPKEPLVLYVGSPTATDSLQRVADLVPHSSANGWFVEVSIPTEALSGTHVITALVQRGRGMGASQILHWRSWVHITDERIQSQSGPLPSSAHYGLDVGPVGLRLEGSGGARPSGVGLEHAPYLSLKHFDGLWQDIDLDGDHNGSPGVSIHVSVPFSFHGSSLSEIFGAHGPSLVDRVHFAAASLMDSFAVVEDHDASAALKAQGIQLEQAYVVLTLNTNADARAFEAAALKLGRRSQLRFAHETAYRQRGGWLGRVSLEHPLLWSTYDRRRYSSDPALLRLITHHQEEGSPMPGFPPVNEESGDGGATRYDVALQIQSQGSSMLSSGQRAPAGIIAAEIVAERRGVGRAKPIAEGDPATLKRFWRHLRSEEAQEAGALPRGYVYVPPQARSGSMVGMLPLVESELSFAQRSFPNSGVSPYDHRGETNTSAELSRKLNLPTHARVIVSAHLRAGALVEGERPARAKRLLPMDAYSQFLIRITLAHPFGESLLLSQDPGLPEAPDQGVFFAADAERSRARVGKAIERGLFLLVLLASVVLAFLFPGPRQFINVLFERLADRVSRSGSEPEKTKVESDPS